MIGANVERMDDRMDAVAAAAATALPARVVKRSFFRHFTDHTPAELASGVVMVISAGERGYNDGLGMEAREGTHRFLLIGHLKVAETPAADMPQRVEAAELDLIEEIKTFVRSGVAGVRLVLDQVQHSRQLEAPYGWVVAYVDAGPPGQTIS